MGGNFGGLMKNCSFSGHRKIPAYEKEALQKQLEIVVRKLIDKGVRNFYTGGALGFDTMAAECILKLKNEYSSIKLTVLVPCPEQPDNWGRGDREHYYDILVKSDKIIYVSDNYSPECMKKRNDALVKNADCLVCFLRNRESGTAYTVKKAAENSLKIIPLGIKKEQKQEFINTFLPEQISFGEMWE